MLHYFTRSGDDYYAARRDLQAADNLHARRQPLLRAYRHMPTFEIAFATSPALVKAMTNKPCKTSVYLPHQPSPSTGERHRAMWFGESRNRLDNGARQRYYAEMPAQFSMPWRGGSK